MCKRYVMFRFQVAIIDFLFCSVLLLICSLALLSGLKHLYNSNL